MIKKRRWEDVNKFLSTSKKELPPFAVILTTSSDNGQCFKSAGLSRLSPVPQSPECCILFTSVFNAVYPGAQFNRISRHKIRFRYFVTIHQPKPLPISKTGRRISYNTFCVYIILEPGAVWIKIYFHNSCFKIGPGVETSGRC